PILLLNEARDDSGSDGVARGIEGWASLGLPSRVWAKSIENELPKETRKERHTLPDPLAAPPLSDLVDDLEVWAIRDDQVVKALTDAPFSSARGPVELLDGEPTKRAHGFVGDQATLRQDGGEVAVPKVVVHPRCRNPRRRRGGSRCLPWILGGGMSQ